MPEPTWRPLGDAATGPPQLFAEAVEFDAFVRHGINVPRGEAYLHTSGRPLDEAVGASDPDGVEADLDCSAGVCCT